MIQPPLHLTAGQPGVVRDRNNAVVFTDVMRTDVLPELVERINAAVELASAMRNVLPVAKDAAAEGPLSRAVLTASVALDRWDEAGRSPREWQPALDPAQKAALADAVEAMKRAESFAKEDAREDAAEARIADGMRYATTAGRQHAKIPRGTYLLRKKFYGVDSWDVMRKGDDCELGFSLPLAECIVLMGNPREEPCEG